MGKGDNQLISSQCQLHVVDKLFSTAYTHADELWMWKLLRQNEGKMQVAPDQNRFQRRAPRPCANTRDCRTTADA